MAKKTFILSQAQAFASSALTEIKWHKVDVMHQTQLFNVTASGDTKRQLIAGIPVEEIVATGSLYDAGTSAFASANAITMTPTNVNIQPGDWVIGKRWGLLDVTGSGDSVKAWVNTIPSVYFSVRGWCLANGFDHTSQTIASWNMSNSTLGTFSGTAMVAQFPVSVPFARGGWLATTVTGEYTNGITYGKGITDWDNIFLDASVNPPANTCALTGTLDNITGTYIPYDVQVRGTRRIGGPLTTVVRFRKDEPAS